jgi:hypothetical protein
MMLRLVGWREKERRREGMGGRKKERERIECVRRTSLAAKVSAYVGTAACLSVPSPGRDGKGCDSENFKG